jgi:hypothetical protein
MSNDYVLFCAEIPKLSPTEEDWLRTEWGSWRVQDAELDDPKCSGIDVSFDGLSTDRTFSIYSEESGKPETAADFLQLFLDRFRPKEVLSFEYVFTNDSGCPEGYGGGAVVLSAARAEWLSTRTWVEEMTKNVLEGK